MTSGHRKAEGLSDPNADHPQTANQAAVLGTLNEWVSLSVYARYRTQRSSPNSSPSGALGFLFIGLLEKKSGFRHGKLGLRKGAVIHSIPSGDASWESHWESPNGR